LSFSLEQVVPWGRSYEEYLAMFAMGPGDLGGWVLGCGDGPAAFNAGLTRRGGRIVSVDPIYRFSGEDIASRIDATYERVMSQLGANLHQFVWDSVGSPEALGRMRMEAMGTFLDDYEAGRRAGRYLPAALPRLPFAAGQFDLALCSHLLFLYTEQLDLDFHLSALAELCRVAGEVRVFPLLNLAARPSPHLPGVVAGLRRAGCEAALGTVGYEFQKHGNQMLRVRARPRAAAQRSSHP